MAKDPAALVYIDKWVAATNGMKAEFRAWYFDLMLYQFDKGPIPNDEDEIAGICRVRPSEYNLFNQMVNQVLKQKFTQNENGCWVNSFADEVITKRKSFKDKRVKSSNIGVVVKMAKKMPGVLDRHIEMLKKELYNLSIEEIEQYKEQKVLNQKVNHLVNLYINEDVNEDKDIHDNIKGGVGENEIRMVDELNLSVLEGQIQNEATWKEGLCRNYKEVLPTFNPQTLEDYIDRFFKTISNDGEESKTVRDFKKHFNRWLQKQISKTLENESESNQSKGPSLEYRRKQAERLGII